MKLTVQTHNLQDSLISISLQYLIPDSSIVMIGAGDSDVTTHYLNNEYRVIGLEFEEQAYLALCDSYDIFSNFRAALVSLHEVKEEPISSIIIPKLRPCTISQIGMYERISVVIVQQPLLLCTTNLYYFTKQIYNILNKGGALLMVNTVLPDDLSFQDTFARCSLTMQKSSGYPIETVRRQKQIEYSSSITQSTTLQICKTAGFYAVTTFFQQFDTIGIVCVK
jgi:hypothetical protein